MEISDAVNLIQRAFLPPDKPGAAGEPFVGAPEVWADLGCGSGLFTYALSTLLVPGSLLYAVDKSPVRLNHQPFPEGIRVEATQKDFTAKNLGLEPLNGLLMANSLHYVRDQEAFIRQIRPLLQEDGRYIIVEYDTDKANPWLPYPLSFAALQRLFRQAGYNGVRKLNERPSAFGRAMLYGVLIEKD